MRRAAKKDDNQAELERVLKACGCSVADTSRLGGGFPDLVVGVAGVNVMIEVKDGDKTPSRRKLTPAELDWHRAWKGTVHIVHDASEALQLVARYRSSSLTNDEQ